jgi:predicted DNA-binding protein (MmcQ/YjbR family)
MAKPAGRAYVDDVPDDVIERLRAICAALPDAYEESAWVGVRWRVRNKTFAHVLAIDDEGVDRRVVLTFRSEGDELEVLRHAGPPFYALGWSRNAMGIHIDDRTDWDELRELITDSYCVMAPKQLIARVDRPPDPTG